MSTTTPITISDIKFIKPAILASSLNDPLTASTTAVIDVRDNDYIGGHIKGSQHVPINQFDARLPELLRVNKDKQRVVFHCMLSQQRGPKAALTYARAKQSAAEKEMKEKLEKEVAEEVEAKDEEKEKRDGWEDVDVSDRAAGRIDKQEICVLEGGFENWQAFYSGDVRLTEGYVKDLWE
ncbi:Cdc25 phosphatase Ibp1 [Neophaeococcomyces mojaviensis]|uniref:Cdc25 phosphatase Ibp1 n=1 Tax=Neophaeococcomyces mojaviensis TaxID=3383035 RepID=A0ACC3AL64_9EURO|nr:Cdc25 phosphatase Ibp1 [Knufia sp. JES_112]